MTKVHHKIARKYLNYTVSKYSYDDIHDARIRFNKMSKTGKHTKIAHVNDLSVPGENIRVRVYRNTASRAPVILFFHGGGFVLGSIESHDEVARKICKYSGCVVVSVDYALAPEYKYPYQTKQAELVYDWLTSESENLNIDKNQVFLVGDSAGASILLDFAMKQKRASTCGIVLVYPTLDPSLTSKSIQKYARGYFLTKKMLKMFWGWYGVNSESYWPPTKKQLANIPPSLIITAELDPLRDEGYELANSLKSLGKDVEYKCHANMLHGFLQFPSVVSSKKQTFKQIADFIKENTI